MNPLCDYNFVNLLLWGGSYDLRFQIRDGFLYIYNFRDDFLYMPLGGRVTLSHLLTLSDDLIRQGYSGNLVLVPEEFIEENCSINRHFESQLDHEDANYIYETSSIVGLSGERLRKKRNHIRQFLRSCPEYQVREIGIQQASQCLELITRWGDTKTQADEETLMYLDMEKEAVNLAFSHFQRLGLQGVGVYVEDSLVAFSIYSSQTSEMASIHFEKYDPSLKGSSPIITWETARFLESRYRFLNREQDLALEGLRKAKRSWDPADMVNTYLLLRRGAKRASEELRPA